MTTIIGTGEVGALHSREELEEMQRLPLQRKIQITTARIIEWYSHLAGNILGQICPQFTLLWLVLSVVGIVILDWMRYAVEGGEKPRYT